MRPLFVALFLCILAAGKVEVTAADGTVTTLEAPQILIATGARTREVPVFPFNGRTIIGSKDALVMEKRPESMIVIGSGAIGSELSYVYHCFGTKVTLVEALPRILPNEDDDVSQAVERSFKKQGITCMAGAKVDALQDNGDSVTATITAKNGKVQEITADVCLVAGGILRDVLTGNVPYVFRSQEVYASAACSGSLVFVVMQYFNCPYELSFILGTIVVFGVRMTAVYLNWQMPSYRPLLDVVHPEEFHHPHDKH